MGYNVYGMAKSMAAHIVLCLNSAYVLANAREYSVTVDCSVFFLICAEKKLVKMCSTALFPMRSKGWLVWQEVLSFRCKDMNCMWMLS